jgi:hypothetical protein
MWKMIAAMSEESTRSLTNWLADHTRMLGALFLLLLVLGQAQPVLAANSSTTPGP